MTYKPLVESIGDYLASVMPPATYGSQGLIMGANLFIARTPAEAPDACVTIIQYEGKPPEFTMGADVVALEFPRIQVNVRGLREDYPGTYSWAQRIRGILASAVLPNETYLPSVIRIEPSDTPNPTGYDNVERPKFTMNFQVYLNAIDGQSVDFPTAP